MKLINNTFLNWLEKERKPPKFPICDFERIRYEVRPGDVLLIEGRSKISEVIKVITQSSWSHSILYIGRLHDIEDPKYRKMAQEHFFGSPETQLVIEGILGKGTVVTPLNHYNSDHIRICRPAGLSPIDAQKVINYTIEKLGTNYDIRQIFDLARFLFPWAILPRKWRSRLFNANPGDATKTVCSTIIAEAFTAVNFPILPHIKHNEDKEIEFIKRNPKLFTPRDFDYSPYFEIIKYPFLSAEEQPAYKNLPWKEGIISHDNENLSIVSEAIQKTEVNDESSFKSKVKLNTQGNLDEDELDLDIEGKKKRKI